jgi:hypothetical protein
MRKFLKKAASLEFVEEPNYEDFELLIKGMFEPYYQYIYENTIKGCMREVEIKLVSEIFREPSNPVEIFVRQYSQLRLEILNQLAKGLGEDFVNKATTMHIREHVIEITTNQYAEYVPEKVL